MRLPILALSLALVACPDGDCESGEYRCDGDNLQTCLDPRGGDDTSWHTVVDCSKDSFLGLGSCYECNDGARVCDDIGVGCDEHGGESSYASRPRGRGE